MYFCIELYLYNYINITLLLLLYDYIIITLLYNYYIYYIRRGTLQKYTNIIYSLLMHFLNFQFDILFTKKVLRFKKINAINREIEVGNAGIGKKLKIG